MRSLHLAALLLLVGCSDVADDPCVDATEATEPQWTQRPALIEVWRIDGTDDGREFLFPASAVLDPLTGRLAILDFGLGEIVVVGLDGSWIGRWGRRGKGPGEISAAIAAAWREGSQLSVYDPASSKVVIFDSTGSRTRDEPVDTDFATALGGGAHWILLGSDGTLLAHPIDRSIRGSDTRKHSIVLKRPHRRLETLRQVELPAVSSPGMMPVTPPGWPKPQAALGPSGVVALSNIQGMYRVEFVGDSLRTPLCRHVEPRPYHADEIADNPDIPVATMEALAAASRPESLAQIGRLLFDSDRRLWVQRDRPRALSGEDGAVGREGALHDVFDATGTYLGEVLMPGRTRLLAATGDILVGLHRDDLDVYSVVGYEMREAR